MPCEWSRKRHVQSTAETMRPLNRNASFPIQFFPPAKSCVNSETKYRTLLALSRKSWRRIQSGRHVFNQAARSGISPHACPRQPCCCQSSAKASLASTGAAVLVPLVIMVAALIGGAVMLLMRRRGPKDDDD